MDETLPAVPRLCVDGDSDGTGAGGSSGTGGAERVPVIADAPSSLLGMSPSLTDPRYLSNVGISSNDWTLRIGEKDHMARPSLDVTRQVDFLAIAFTQFPLRDLVAF